MQSAASFVIRFKKPFASLLLLTFVASAAQLTSIGFSFPAPAQAATSVWFSGQTHPWLDCGPDTGRSDRGRNCNPGGHWQDLSKDAGQPPVLLMANLKEGQTVSIVGLTGKVNWGQKEVTCRDGESPNIPKQVAIGQFTDDNNQVVAVPGGGVDATNAILLKSFDGNGIKVPAGATRLYGSFPDSRYYDNVGQCDMTINVTTPQCQDGIDNDNDGSIDFPADPGCSSIDDNDESPVNKATFSISKTIVTTGDINPGSNVRYSIKFKNTSNVTAHNAQIVDNIPTGMTYVPQESSNYCAQQGSAVNCPIPFIDPNVELETIITFNVNATATCGSQIMNQADIQGQNVETNWGKVNLTVQCKAQCQDGIDNDNDGAVDYPADFSCSSPTDNDETNPKAQCQDGIDNDQDGLIDFPQDPGCTSNQDNDEGPKDVPTLQITKDALSPTVQRNGVVQFSVKVKNNGAVRANNVVVTDAIPSNMTLAPGSTSNFCTQQGTSVVCPVPFLDPTVEQEVTIGFTASASASCNSSIRNTATAKADNASQVSDDATVQVQCVFQCQDGIDNDNDGAVDYPNDFSCSSPTDDDETNPKAQCQDGIDNDGDGLVDFPQDPGCSSNQDNDEFNQVTPQCSDGIDNDNDGAVDYPNDFSCSSPTDNDETNPKAQCQDGIDNDQDGLIDFPQDPGCTSNQDNDEGPQNFFADLSITKTGPASIEAGKVAVYTLTVANAGPGKATNVTVSDLIPTGLTFNASQSDPSCAMNNVEVLCNNLTLNAGASKSITVAFSVPVQTGACTLRTVFNTASVATSATDPNPSNNQSALVTTNVTCPVLPQCQDGIDNDNDGAVDYPNDFSCSSPTDDDETNPKAQCQDGIDNDQDGLIDFPQDPGCSSNQDNDEFNAAQDADIMTSKSGPQTVLPGGILTYTVTVKNLGQGSASQVAISDPVPAGVTFNAALSDASCTLIGPSVNCGFYTLAPHATKSVTLSFNVPQNAVCSSVIQNQAEAWAKEGDPNGANNHSAVISTSVQCTQKTQCSDGLDNDGDNLIDFPQDPGCSSAQDNDESNVNTNVDLSLTKSGPATVLPGGTAVYTLTATNAGPGIATNVVIADPVPAGVTFNSAQSSNNCIQNGINILCNNITLNPGESISVTVAFNVPMQNVNQCVSSTIFNTASVSTSATEINPPNNQSQLVSTLIQCPTPIAADLSIVKSGPQTALPGGLVVYTLTAMNNGPSSASGMKLTDLVPVGLTFNASQSDSSCHIVGTNVECGTFTLAVGATKSVQLSFQVPMTASCSSTILNTATVSAVTTDPNAFNNQSQVVTTTVQCPVKTADLSITKTGPSTVQAGSVIVYTLTATNAGPDTATNVTMADPVPAGLTFNAAQSSTNCVQNGANILCDNITLTSGQSTTVQVAFSIPGPSGAQCPVTSIVNTASVSTSVTDPNPANNQSQTVYTTVQCAVSKTADVSIVKYAPSTVVRGQTLSYTLVAMNAGPSTATGVVVTDAIPSGLTFASSGSDSSCSQNGSSIRCDLGTLSASQTKTFTVAFTVSQTAACPSTILNTANITSAVQDTNTANNQSQAVSTTVQCEQQNPTFSVTKSDGRSTTAAGDTLTYSIAVTNTSTVNATNVTVTDALPSQLTFSSASDGGLLNGSLVTWSNLSIPAGQTKTLTLLATVKSTVQSGEVITNTASANSQASGSDSTTVQNPVTTGCIDIVKLVFDVNGNSVSQMPVFTFRTGSQSVQNDTTGRARFTNLTPGNYTVTEDTLSGWTQYSIVPTGGTVTVSGGSSCSVVTFINRQQSSSSSSSTGTPTFTITKTDGQSTVYPGQNLNYTITVTNTSTVNATNVTVTDVLPSQVTYIASSNGGVLNGSLITWSNLSIAAGQSMTLTLTVMVQSTMTQGVITNVAQVGSSVATDTTMIMTQQQPQPPYYPPYPPQPPYVPPVQPPYIPPVPPSTGFKPYPYQVPVTGGEGGNFFTATDGAVLTQVPSESGSLMAYISILVTTMAGLASAAGGTALKFMTI